MGLPLAGLNQAADFLSEKFVVYDEVSSKTLGRWAVSATDPDRVIFGVLQTNKTKDIKLGEDGALSDGSLMLHTRFVLSAYDVSQDGQILRQTYARYGGEVWKIHRRTDWVVKTGAHRLYYLTKYLNVGGLP